MLRKITNIDEVFDYLEENDYLESVLYMITDFSYDSKNIKVKLESKENSITFVFKEIIENWFDVQCTNVDGFELSELLFFEQPDGVLACKFSSEFEEEQIFVKFKKVELIIEDISSSSLW